MPWEGKNSLQWQRSLLLLFVHLQLPGRRIHREVGAIGSDELELLQDNMLKPEEDLFQYSKPTVLFKSSK